VTCRNKYSWPPAAMKGLFMQTDLPTFIESFDRALTVNDLAAILSISNSNLYGHCRRGTVPYCLVGGAIRFDPHLIANWLRSRTLIVLSKEESTGDANNERDISQPRRVGSPGLAFSTVGQSAGISVDRIGSAAEVATMCRSRRRYRAKSRIPLPQWQEGSRRPRGAHRTP